MSRWWLVLVVALFWVPIQAQDYGPDYWHEGTAYLLGGDSIKGRLMYDFPGDNLQVDMGGGTVTTYNATQLDGFHLRDFRTGADRYFYAFSFQTQTGYERQVLFELLVGGPLSLLSREQVVIQTNAGFYNPYGFSTYPTQQRVLEVSYFVKRGTGTIKILEPNKKRVLALMGTRSGAIQNYVKGNKLSYDRRPDLMAIFAYYNQLSRP